MKKIIYSVLSFILAINIANAKPVTPATAKTVAENFYKQNSKIGITTSTLVYTEVSAAGLPVYYVFDINSNDGFVIVAAEDATHPIIGYSTSKHFVSPKSVQGTNNIGFWLKSCSTGINTMRAKGRSANPEVASQWEKYIANIPVSTARLSGNQNVMTTSTPVVAPLVQSTWNQSPYYNADCPGSTGTGTNTAAAVTGCVATTMAQIMRYWSYPAQGTGSSSYTQNPNPNGYPAQSANYGTTTYDWANMPLDNSSITGSASTYTAVALLMHQCGISVNMDYSPSGSSAYVITADNATCAQHSYVTYFKYNSSTISGLRRTGHTEAAWLTLIENDLNIGRPVQYVGTDPSEGGHTWVCDGYDQNNYLHMNWGWGGQSDGYFQVDSLTTPGFDPSTNHEALLGIVPMTSNTYDAGVPAVVSPVGSYCSTGTNTLSVSVKLQNFGSSTLTACTINYSIDGVVQSPLSWTGSLVSYQFTNVSLPTLSGTSSGTHTLVCFSSDPNGATDQNSANDTSTVLFTVTSGGVLPIIEGFETSSCPTGILPNANWNVFHSASSGVDFTITSSAAATGSQSCMLNNLNNVGGDTSTIQTASFYDLTTLTTPSLTFKAAYQKKSTATNTDKLQIFTSTDCGNSWISRKVITSATLSSLAGGTGTSTYIPTPSQFTTYTVPIVAVASSHNVMFRWEFFADATSPGNDLYIDDINIVDAAVGLGIESIEASVGLNLYPNPSTGKVNIDFNLSEQHSVSVTVTDMLGRTVETIPSSSYQSGETTLVVGASNTYQAGVYLVNINIDGQHIAKKVIIQ